MYMYNTVSMRAHDHTCACVCMCIAACVMHAMHKPTSKTTQHCPHFLFSPTILSLARHYGGAYWNVADPDARLALVDGWLVCDGNCSRHDAVAD